MIPGSTSDPPHPQGKRRTYILITHAAVLDSAPGRRLGDIRASNTLSSNVVGTNPSSKTEQRTQVSVCPMSIMTDKSLMRRYSSWQWEIRSRYAQDMHVATCKPANATVEQFKSCICMLSRSDAQMKPCRQSRVRKVNSRQFRPALI